MAATGDIQFAASYCNLNSSHYFHVVNTQFYSSLSSISVPSSYQCRLPNATKHPTFLLLIPQRLYLDQLSKILEVILGPNLIFTSHIFLSCKSFYNILRIHSHFETQLKSLFILYARPISIIEIPSYVPKYLLSREALRDPKSPRNTPLLQEVGPHHLYPHSSGDW